MTSVLVFSRDAEWYGGVVNFVALLRRFFNREIEYSQFKIGRRKGGRVLLLQPLVPVFDALRLWSLLRQRRYDAYHVNPSLNYSSLVRDGLFMLVLRLMRARNVIVSFHGWSERVEKQISRSKILSWLFRAVFGYADHTLVLAEDFRSWLIGNGFEEGRVHLFTTMFDSDEFAGMDRPSAQRNEFRILFLSRLVREKGMYELADAFRALSRDYPELRLVFAGNGPEEATLRQYVEGAGLAERVEFLGYVRGADKVRAFAQSGMFVFPTYYGEGCPVSLLEAMAAGLPVITSPVGGIPHIVQDGVNGILLDSVSSESVEKAMRRLLDDAGLRHEIGARNADEAWRKYSAPVVTQLFERLYSGQGV
ncbi:MAG TPA: glycosyltransferase family 4 protein [Gammaproteobacteria bacterium]